jgi:hypothetical protein
VVNVVVVKDKITTLTTDRNTQRDGRISAEDERDKTKKELATTQRNLAQRTQERDDAITARKTAEDNEAAATKRADDLSEKLTQTTQDRDDAQNQLAAYKATGKNPEDIGKLAKALEDSQKAVIALNDEQAFLNHKILGLQAELNEFIGTNADVLLPPTLTGKVLVVDPKWDFVVLNIGQDEGVLNNGQLLVSRDGKLVAKIIVRSMEKDRCIANIMPGWKLGEVIEGDDVSPAHPSPST